MAHLRNNVIKRIEGKHPVECNKSCKYWKFPHLDIACVLSEVFSVRKGVYCFEYTPKIDNQKIQET